MKRTVYNPEKHAILLKYGLAQIWLDDDSYDPLFPAAQKHIIVLTAKGHSLIAKLLKAFEEEKEC